MPKSSANKKPHPVERAAYTCPPVAGRKVISFKQTGKKVGCHYITIYRHLKNIPDFPRPIAISPGRRAFFEDEIDHYIATRPRM
jgi:predicted DNA-binding transcriptional regulator AlpA